MRKPRKTRVRCDAVTFRYKMYSLSIYQFFREINSRDTGLLFVRDKLEV
jgi:hypothetical protein